MSSDLLLALHKKLDILVDRLSARDRRFMGIPDAAGYSGLSPKSIRRLLASGKLTILRPVRGRIVIDRVELDALVLNSTATPRKGRGMTT